MPDEYVNDNKRPTLGQGKQHLPRALPNHNLHLALALALESLLPMVMV